MANKKHGNMIYVDTTDSTFAAKNTRLLGAVVTAATKTSLGSLTLQNSGASNNACLDFGVAANEVSKHFDFSGAPLLFPDGIRVTSLTNATVTLIISIGGAGGS